MDFPIQKSSQILRVEDLSNHFITNARITFTNGCVLSISYGAGTYGSWSGLLEIWLWSEDGRLTTKVEEIFGPSPRGWMTVDEVKQWITIAGNL